MKYAATYSYPTPKMRKILALRSPVSSASRFVKAPALSLIMALSVLLAPIASAQESVEVGYEFSRGKLTELSAMKTTLAIPAFSDERAVSDNREIFSGELADGGAVLAEKPLAEIVAEAMRAGFMLWAIACEKVIVMSARRIRSCFVFIGLMVFDEWKWKVWV